MMRVKTGRLLVPLLIFAALCVLAPAVAEEQPEQTFKSLVARGFKVVATNFISPQASSSKYGYIVVTLQQEKAVAVCVFSLGAWEEMTKLTLEDSPKSCSVRFY